MGEFLLGILKDAVRQGIKPILAKATQNGVEDAWKIIRPYLLKFWNEVLLLLEKIGEPIASFLEKVFCLIKRLFATINSLFTPSHAVA